MGVAGRFRGNARVVGEMHLEKRAFIDGDLTVVAIDVEDGATMNGRVFMKKIEEFGDLLDEKAQEPGGSGVKP